MHCGYPLTVSEWWLQNKVGDPRFLLSNNQLSCPACKRTDGWKKTIMTRSVADIHKEMRRKGQDPELHKVLLIASKRYKFKNAQPKLQKRYRRFHERIDEEKNPIKKRIMIGIAGGDVPEDMK